MPFSGPTVGAGYALVALGFTLIYNASDVINFTQGECVMIGGIAPVFVAAADRWWRSVERLMAYDWNDDRTRQIRCNESETRFAFGCDRASPAWANEQNTAAEAASCRRIGRT